MIQRSNYLSIFVILSILAIFTTSANGISKPTTQTSGSADRVAGPRIQTSILMVNGQAITASEIIVVCHEDLRELAKKNSIQAFRSRAVEKIKQTVQDTVSEILLYQQMQRKITEQQEPAVDKAVDKALRDMIMRKANGSQARLERMLQKQGSNIDQVRGRLRRQILSKYYLEEKFSSKIHVGRDELWQYYREHADEFRSPKRVYLHLIQIDAEHFLPDGKTWKAASADLKQRAVVLAGQDAADARQKLLDAAAFDDVARKHSTAASGKNGGQLGWISGGSFRIKQVDQVAFSLSVDQISEIIEVGREFFIVKVSDIQQQKVTAFADVQQQILPELERQQYTKLVSQYLAQLWKQATIGQLEPFLTAIGQQMPSYEQLRR